MPFRFIHTADIHLDSPLRSLALRDPELAELIGNATRRAFTNIIDLCLAEQVDALLLAGDLYDGDQTSMKTARFLADGIGKLHHAGIRVFIIRGNHDALSRITKELTFPDSVKIFGGRAEAIELAARDGGMPVTIHGISFAQPHAPESLLPKYKSPVSGAVNIGLMHTSLAGAPGHDLYAPCSLADLDAAGFDYWALGHIHKRSESRNRSAIIMPGLPQGRDINEDGAKTVTLVTIGDDRSIKIEECQTCVAQFERVPVNLTGVDHWIDMLRALERALAAARHRVRSQHLVARLLFTGVTPLAWQLRRDIDLVRAEAEQRGITVGKTWIDAVKIECRAQDPHSGEAPDPLAELARLIGQEVLQTDAYRIEMAAMAEELRAQLPAECRFILGSDQEEFAASLASLAEEGAQDILARLHANAASEQA